MLNHKVSILIPAFNSARWIKPCIQSVLEQNHENLEAIVVDDGSTDETLSILKEFTDERLKIVSQKNQGSCTARNIAFEKSSGDFIQYLDADDFLSNDKISSQVKLISDMPTTLALSDRVNFYDGEDPITNGRLSTGWPLIDSDCPISWLVDLYGPDGHGGMVQPGSWLVPRELCVSAGPWDEDLNSTPDDDGEYFCRVVLQAKKIRKSPTGCVYYRQFKQGKSLSGGKTPRALDGRLQALKKTSQHLLKSTDSVSTKRALARRFSELAQSSFAYNRSVYNQSLIELYSLGETFQRQTFGSKKAELLSKFIGWKNVSRIAKWKEAKS